MGCKKMQSTTDEEQCGLRGKFKETLLQSLLRRCQKLIGTKDVKLYDNALKGLIVLWAAKKGILLEGTKWWTEQRERRKVMTKFGKKLGGYWGPNVCDVKCKKARSNA